jgi:hypothetical protein
MHKENSVQTNVGEQIQRLQGLAREVGFIDPDVTIYRINGITHVDVLDDGEIGLREAGDLNISLIKIIDTLKTMYALMDAVI